MSFEKVFVIFVCSLLILVTNGALTHKRCSKSCSNDGFCLELGGAANCYCLPEWEGESCDNPRKRPQTYQFIEINEVLRKSYRNVPCTYVPDLCRNGGICFLNETEKKLDCQCPYPYAGSRCEEISVCYNYCFNNGVCTVDKGKPKCECSDEFTGERCQSVQTTTTTEPPSTTTDIICSYLPDDYCKNKGSCIVQNGRAACLCPPTHTGKSCEIPIGGPPVPTTLRPITPGPIIPGPVTPGPIIPIVTNPPGNLIIGSCSSNPCLNNRPCYESGNSYYCFCGSYYTGSNCQTPFG